MKTQIIIPRGKLASTNPALTEAQRKIREALRTGNPIRLSSNGDVTGRSGQPTLTIPPGKLASTNPALTEAQRKIREALRTGNPIRLSSNGDVTGRSGQPTLTIPPGKLAYEQWYEREPERLEAEIAAMQMSFPQFTLTQRPDGKLVWTGTLRPGLLGEGSWDWVVEAVYQNNHPQAQMGSSVHVYLRQPDIDTLINATGWRPHHLLHGEEGVYLCTNQADNMHVGRGSMETSAATVLRWAVKWLAAYELVLAGQLTQQEFDRPNGI